jgi:hypothetical protein
LAAVVADSRPPCHATPASLALRRHVGPYAARGERRLSREAGRITNVRCASSVPLVRGHHRACSRAHQRCGGCIRRRRALLASAKLVRARSHAASLRDSSSHIPRVGCRVGCIALRAPQDDKEDDDEGGATLLAALARDADHTGGVLCALRLNDGEEHAVCEALTELPLQPNRCAATQHLTR